MAPQAESPAARRVGRQPPKQAGAKGGLSSSQGGKKGGSLTPCPPVHGKEGQLHREWGFEAPELGFISACPGETSL